MRSIKVAVDLTDELHSMCEPPGRSRDSLTRTPPDGLRHYNHLAPVGDRGLVRELELVRMRTWTIPLTVQLEFTPSRDLDLQGVQLVVVTYIFSNDLSKREAIIDTGDTTVNRKSLFLLVPKAEVEDDVLNAVVTMLSNESPSYNWFIPTIIMQAVIEGRQLSGGALARIAEVHMRCPVDQVFRVFVPMWCPGHWYLMILDIHKTRLIYCDSNIIDSEVVERRVSMERVALFLESMTLGQTWLSSMNAKRPAFSTFKFHVEQVPQQKRGSIDCGIWVAEWMIREKMWADHRVEGVGEDNRMKLAIDLVLRSHNKLAREVVLRAFSHWKAKASASFPTRRAL
ncbi:hypothetical protein PIB30_072968 [Stylosanthes scabra]|uniref:Ubiquitin-like protease family profile domain-containing protein n=1 Tax=Stylosanthes scabra TaxID=79078 RepID=A0ABU6SPC7_9FABA|nr:hypothetical protein [Stylosanthes scabra]